MIPLPKINAPSRAQQLDHALETAWVALQPIRRATDGSVAGYEALLRTRSPHLCSPLQVLAAASELSRLWTVGRCARRLAAHDGPADVMLYVNVIGTDLLDPELGSDTCPLRPIAERVVLEVTEHAPLSEVPGLQRRLERLRAAGFRFALDDFGVGHATWATWALLDPEVVKVDRQLITAWPTCAATRRRVEAAVRWAHASGAVVVAEGIETECQRDTCVAAGFDLLQGYLLGRPVPVDALPRGPVAGACVG